MRKSFSLALIVHSPDREFNCRRINDVIFSLNWITIEITYEFHMAHSQLALFKQKLNETHLKWPGPPLGYNENFADVFLQRGMNFREFSISSKKHKLFLC